MPSLLLPPFLRIESGHERKTERQNVRKKKKGRPQIHFLPKFPLPGPFILSLLLPPFLRIENGHERKKEI